MFMQSFTIIFSSVIYVVVIEYSEFVNMFLILTMYLVYGL
jgi:hypothetical protein